MDSTYGAESFAEVFEANFTWPGGFERNVRRFAVRDRAPEDLKSGKLKRP